ncbi:MAG: shikimate kinase [Clostridia bacterium]
MSKQIYGLLGRTLGHSYSPAIHKAFGLPDYRLIEKEPNELAAFLRRDDLGAVNITIPYKIDAMKLCDDLSETAQAIGSVNTVVRQKDGRLFGHNTDAFGFHYMAKRAGISFQNRKVVILGGGGASLTAQHIAENEGAKEIIVVDLDRENNYENIDRHYDGEIIINATPVGMYPQNGKSLIDLKHFSRCRGVLDMIYNPRRTALLMQAEEAKIPFSDGLPMLVAQAKTAEETFFGKAIPDETIPEVLSLLRRETENIILIGMPGCGKTTVGRALAKITGKDCIDIDEEIEKDAGKTIPEIFETMGEAAFREVEQKKIAEAGAFSGKIITTGGGAVKTEENYPLLHQNGRIYHLRRDTAALARKGRPLSAHADLKEMEQRRAPLYRRFRDAEIDNNGAPKETAEKIWRDFCAYTGH